MKKLIFFIGFICFVVNANVHAQAPAGNKQLEEFFNNYYEENLKLNPLNATSIGDQRYNDLLPVQFSDSYRTEMKRFYNRYLEGIKKFDRSKLNDNDKISYDIFKREMEISLLGLTFPTNLMPLNQFYGLQLTLGQLGSGDGAQPFKTVKDYDNWIKRASKFPFWVDSAIVYFEKGIQQNIVLPKALVVKMVPQLDAMQVADPTKSLFYGPINKIPASFSEADKTRLTNAYVQLITEQILPAYKKLSAYLKTKYMESARSSSGLSGLKDGDKMYSYFIQNSTTTNKSADELFNTGLSEVKRIREEMEKVKSEVGYKGDLKEFFNYMQTNKKFLPYSTAEEVLDAYRAVEQRIQPSLPKMFNHFPTTKFEVRQTEAFRAASASAQYNRASEDGSRPGIFYVPIIDPKKYVTAKENLFLHEAIPGHHYQISLQQENKNLPKFRRFGGYSAFSEGWALYCESLGKELGVYTDPYQYMNALGGEIHRAIRLVVDAGMHSKGWTREQSIQYMLDNEPISEQAATAEIERYMAIPGQALSYKVGQMKITELRDRYTKQLGSRFNLSNFHDEVLKDGAMPLDVFERKMNAWAAKQK